MFAGGLLMFVCLFCLYLFVSFESVTVTRALASLSPVYMGTILNTLRLLVHAYLVQGCS